MLKFVVYSCDSIGSLFLCFKWVLGILVRRERKRYDGEYDGKKEGRFFASLISGWMCRQKRIYTSLVSVQMERS